jgi:hypothetical protein
MAKNKMTYSHFEHRHNFAAWCAARAVQRGFAKSTILKQTIEASGVREFLKNSGGKDLSQKEFDGLHESWCKAVIEFWERNKVEGRSYGRAAKLVAIYIKSMMVVQDEPNGLAEVAHPPIDSIILRNISGDKNISHPRKAYWKKIRWTLLDEEAYKQMITDFRQVCEGKPFWLIEEYWTIEDD